MKITLTLIVTFFIAIANVFGQSQFYNIAVGVNAGMSTAFTGLNYKSGLAPFEKNEKSLMINKSSSFGGSLDYYFTPFLNAGIEYNMTSLKDGPDKHNRQFTSSLTSIELRAGVSLGQFVDYTYNDILYALRGLNISIGYGMISGSNTVKDYIENIDAALGIDERGNVDIPESQRKIYNPAGYRQHAGDLGKSKFSNVSMVPFTIGYNFIVYNQYEEQKMLVGINLKTVITGSDDLDGFNDDPKIFNNKAKDLYSVFGVSLKYMFGPRSLYYGR